MTEVLVRKLRHLDGHRFWVEFTDGMAGVWDYSHIKTRTGSMAKPLHDESYIVRAFLEMGAPTWPNGWDVSPEALYSDLKAAGALKSVADAEPPV